MYFPTDLNFPKQRVSAEERNKPEFYANSCDWLIGQALSIAQIDDIEKKYHFLKGNIDFKPLKSITDWFNTILYDALLTSLNPRSAVTNLIEANIINKNMILKILKAKKKLKKSSIIVA